MLAEEYSNINSTPFLSNQEGKTISFIYECLKKSFMPFKKALSQPNLKPPLNENKYTQIFLHQLEVSVKLHPNISVNNQYSDLFYGTKGVPDFYFYKIEQGVVNEPLMVWEAKILSTSLDKKREKEYVIGNKNNGGIERFKTEKHGKGQNKCGLLGFVENENFKHWNTTINSWINDLTSTNIDWKKDEVLSEIETDIDFCVLTSIVHRKSDDINLTHLWVSIN